jgi:integrase
LISRAASAALGGSGSGCGRAGLSAISVRLIAIHFQRTALASAPERIQWTHQRRRIALDPDTVEILRDHRTRWEQRVAKLGGKPDPESFVFSLTPHGSEPMKPSTVTQKYARMAARLKIDTNLHALRYYSATELIAAGVDVRAVAGRLGHGGGGATTLRVYAAWLSESDQRAALAMTKRLPRPQTGT